MAASLRSLLAYLEAFEVAYDEDTWDVLDDHFTSDASYAVEGAPPFTGIWQPREQIKQQFKRICDAFDRRFDERIVAASGRPKLSGDTIHFVWQATYKLKGAPDFLLTGKSAARMIDGKIAGLKDIIPEDECRAGEKYLRDHEARLRKQGDFIPIRRVPSASSASQAMFDALWAEIQKRYGFQAPNPMAFSLFAAPQSALFIAFAKEVPVGSIGFYPSADRSAELDAMYVAPHERGTGLAQRLLAVAERFARQNKFDSMRLRAGKPQPEAIRFYEKAGFQPGEPFGKWIGDPTALCFAKKL